MSVLRESAVPSAVRPGETTRGARGAWGQVLLAAVLMLATLPGRTLGLGLITEPLLVDLQLERGSYATMNLWATVLGALACFPIGWVIDRVRLRWVCSVVLVLLGLTVWRFSALTAGVASIFGLLLATRAFGQSALSVCSITAVARWFPNRAGFAMGIYSVAISFLFAAAFGVIGWSVRAHGWRSTWFQIAIMLIVVIAPLAAFAMREPGVATVRGKDAEDQRTDGPIDGFTLAQALRSRAFWVFAGAAASFNLVYSGMGLFNEAILAERGFDQKTFHYFLAGTALLSLGGQFVSGWLTRRFRHQGLTFAALFLYGVGLAAIPFVRQAWQLWCVAFPIGIGGGMIVVTFFSVWGDLFGQGHLGRIQGAAQMLTVLSSGLGPLVFAKCAEAYHSYAPLLFVSAAAVFILGVLAKDTRNPLQPTSEREPPTPGKNNE